MQRYLLLISIGVAFIFGAVFVLANSGYERTEYPDPREYAPNFWFDSEEKYYPTDPLDFYYDSELNELDGSTAVAKYDALSLEEKLDAVKVFYRIDDLGGELVYQYWLFYVMNNYENGHYGDWESVFVFVDEGSKNVNRVVGSAHGSGHELKIKQSDVAKHIWVYVGNGSHANCPDEVGDGRCDFKMWRFQGQGFEWTEEDVEHGKQFAYSDYSLNNFSDSYVDNFGSKKSFDKQKSPTLGLNPYKVLKLDKLPFLETKEEKYINFPIIGDFFGGTPTFAWTKEEYNNPEKMLESTPTRLARSVGGFFKNTASAIAGIGLKISSPITSLFTANTNPSGSDPDGSEERIASAPGALDEFNLPGPDPDSDWVQTPTNDESADVTDVGDRTTAGGTTPTDTSTDESVIARGLTPSGGQTPDEPETEIVLVSRVIDGDTVELSSGQKLRYIGINASELPDDCFAEEATQRNRELVENKQVILLEGPTDTDKYGRLLRFVWEDVNLSGTIDSSDVFINRILVAEGYAYAFDFGEDHQYGHVFESAESAAKRERKGLWGDVCLLSEFLAKGGEPTEDEDEEVAPEPIVRKYEPPSSYSPISTDDSGSDGGQDIDSTSPTTTIAVAIVVNEIQIDDAEFVELYNPTSNAVSLRGYYFSYYPSTRTEWNNPYRNKAFLEDAEIQSEGYYLIGVKDYPASFGDPNSDWDLGYASGQLHNSNGTVAVFPFDPTIKNTEEARDGVIDAVGWGEVSLSEASAAQAPPQGSSITRDQSHSDTDNNASDFSIASEPTPKQNAAEEEEEEEGGEEEDTTAPAVVAGLEAAPGSARGTITLEWTAPGDDENEGVAASYVIKYATEAITTETWEAAQDYSQSLVPKEAGQQESFTLENLTLGQEYYFALRALDEAGNISTISNNPSSQPSAVPIDLVINEIQLEDAEFVELYNPTSNTASLSGYYFSYYSSARTDWTNPHRNKEFPEGAQIPASGYYLIGLKDYATSFGNPSADWQPYSSAQFNNSKGTIAIFSFDPTSASSSQYAYDNRGDAVGWDNDFDGDGNDVSLYEQSPATTTPVVGESLARDSSHSDTNNNLSDFSVAASTTPTNSSGETYDPNLSFAPLWAMYQKNTRHSGLTTLAGPSWSNTSQATSTWIFSMDASGSSSPVVDYLGVVYVMDGQGKVYAINPNGTQKWKFEPQVQGGDGSGWADGSPALSLESQRVYSTYTTTSNPYKLVLYSIKTDDGSLDWKYSPSESGYNQSFTSPIVDANGNIYVASKSRLYSVSSSGNLNWEKILSPSDLNPNIRIPAIGDDGYIYVMAKVSNNAGDRYIWKLDPADGSEVWKENPTGNNALFNGLSINATGTIYTGGYLSIGTSGVFAVDPSDGSKIWSNNVGDASGVVPNFDAGGNIYIGRVEVMNSGALYKMNATGTLVWTFTPEAPSAVRHPAVIDSQGRVYVGAMNKNVYALDPQDRAIIWQYELSDEAQGFAIGNGVVYVVTYDGKVYAF